MIEFTLNDGNRTVPMWALPLIVVLVLPAFVLSFLALVVCIPAGLVALLLSRPTNTKEH